MKRIHVGLAGWANPPSRRSDRRAGQSHLSYYAEHFSCVEINSSFYRPHLAKTYARWKDETPPSFLFSAKMPRSITHEARLKRCAAEVARFYGEVAHLQPKLVTVLVQLPPSLEFNAATVRAFFGRNLAARGVSISCEPRHPSWFTPAADDALRRADVSRVAADPARVPDAALPGGERRFAYFRWHGSPKMYYSKYTPAQLAAFAARARAASAHSTWCIFDNTARYAAWDNGLKFLKALASPPRPSRLRSR